MRRIHSCTASYQRIHAVPVTAPAVATARRLAGLIAQLRHRLAADTTALTDADNAQILSMLRAAVADLGAAADQLRTVPVEQDDTDSPTGSDDGSQLPQTDIAPAASEQATPAQAGECVVATDGTTDEHADAERFSAIALTIASVGRPAGQAAAEDADGTTPTHISPVSPAAPAPQFGPPARQDWPTDEPAAIRPPVTGPKPVAVPQRHPAAVVADAAAVAEHAALLARQVTGAAFAGLSAADLNEITAVLTAAAVGLDAVSAMFTTADPQPADRRGGGHRRRRTRPAVAASTAPAELSPAVRPTPRLLAAQIHTTGRAAAGDQRRLVSAASLR